jgi:hypothetical protein
LCPLIKYVDPRVIVVVAASIVGLHEGRGDPEEL